MTLDEAISELRIRNEPVPRPARLPSEAEVDAAEVELGVTFHPDYRKFLLAASDVVYNIIEPATITERTSHTDLFRITERASVKWGVPRELLPICHDNADYYCMNKDGQVVFWSHDMHGLNGEVWADLATWIEQVWLIDYDDE